MPLYASMALKQCQVSWNQLERFCYAHADYALRAACYSGRGISATQLCIEATLISTALTCGPNPCGHGFRTLQGILDLLILFCMPGFKERSTVIRCALALWQ